MQMMRSFRTHHSKCIIFMFSEKSVSLCTSTADLTVSRRPPLCRRTSQMTPTSVILGSEWLGEWRLSAACGALGPASWIMPESKYVSE